MTDLPTPAAGTIEIIHRVDPTSPQAGPKANYFAANPFGRVRVFATEATARSWARGR